MDDNQVASFVASEPKFAGVLFTAALLLTQTMSTTAPLGSAVSGP